MGISGFHIKMMGQRRCYAPIGFQHQLEHIEVHDKRENHSSFFSNDLINDLVENGFKKNVLDESAIIELLQAVSYSMDGSVDTEILCNYDVIQCILNCVSFAPVEVFEILTQLVRAHPQVLEGLTVDLEMVMTSLENMETKEAAFEFLSVLITSFPNECSPYFMHILRLHTEQKLKSYALCVKSISKVLTHDITVDYGVFINRVFGGLCSGCNQNIWAQTLVHAIENGDNCLIGKCCEMTHGIIACLEASELDTVICAYKVLRSLTNKLTLSERIRIYQDVCQIMGQHLQCAAYRLIRAICKYLSDVSKYYCIENSTISLLIGLFETSSFRQQRIIATTLTEIFYRRKKSIAMDKLFFGTFETLVHFALEIDDVEELQKLAAIQDESESDQLTSIFQEALSACAFGAMPLSY